jgi:hypothetical protein
MHLQIQPSVDIASVHPSVLPLLENPAPPELWPPEPRTAAATRKRFKHGLHSRHAVVPGESREAFREFRHDLIQDLRPVDAEECGVVEQMVVAQWRLKRLWATQTGMYERFEQNTPPQAGDSHPLRLADCFSDDCAHERELDKLSLHEVRLVNIFHRCGRRLDLLRDQRRKQFSRPKGRPFPGEEVFYGQPDAARAPAAQPPASSPGVEVRETAATPSPDTASGENADRDPAAVAAQEALAAAGADRPGADRDPPLPGPTAAEVGSPGAAGAAPADSQRPDAQADAGNLPDVGADRDPPQRDWRAAIDGRVTGG